MEEQLRLKRKCWERQFFERGNENVYFVSLMKNVRAEGEEFIKIFAHVSEVELKRK